MEIEAEETTLYPDLFSSEGKTVGSSHSPKPTNPAIVSTSQPTTPLPATTASNAGEKHNNDYSSIGQNSSIPTMI